MPSETLQNQIASLPENPGVYLMKNAQGEIIYVGKAAVLKDRVKSYFVPPSRLEPKTRQLVSQINELEYLITGSEQEALILELNLIKRHRPYFNVRLKDDKGFPYLKITLNEKWPRIYITRSMADDGGRYFGPFASTRSVRHTLQVLKELFRFRSCNRTEPEKRSRPCLEYDIHQCLSPCTGKISKQDYDHLISQAILFLEGKQDKVLKLLAKLMNEASARLDYETAALRRDQISSIKEVIEGQQLAARVSGEQDAIAFAQEGDLSMVQVFFIRRGKLIGRESFSLQGTREEKPGDILSEFVKQFYHSSTQIPPKIVTQYPLSDREILEKWLSERRGGKVQITAGLRGQPKDLINIVAENAREQLKQARIKNLSSAATLTDALEELQTALGLPLPPQRIEGYDISNIQGTNAVGSMVVFENGKPQKAHYRRFRIKTVKGADDFSMLKEVISRRFGRLNKDDAGESFARQPSLMLIDGGKGQLSSVKETLDTLGLEGQAVIGLAKEFEEIYLPGKSEPIRLTANSPALQLLQRVRDEAHRFALGYHLNIRHKSGLASALDGIPGIGPSRRRLLIKTFGSVSGIHQASLEELSQVKGINQALALSIKELL
ncbi:excinuclease ABC subunit C [Dehalococcoides mccartyi]|uniref:UvrABC system protein C n=1 Tax=Dehalococcoides mccartyi TaxID=61435 RepID=A0A0V8M006_9CHLR|nr:excinuclease ABC subunit UvrC [Dehalococcoides mccartyi]KSV17111.1 excinuclease ABC subunit C [Dehalococcoides mccartyi]